MQMVVGVHCGGFNEIAQTAVMDETTTASPAREQRMTGFPHSSALTMKPASTSSVALVT